MIIMLCRNRVREYRRWREVFDDHRVAHEAAGLTLTGMWRERGDENNIFFTFRVEDVDRARAFVEDPDSAEAGEVSGVVDGEITFLEPVPDLR